MRDECKILSEMVDGFAVLHVCHCVHVLQSLLLKDTFLEPTKYVISTCQCALPVDSNLLAKLFILMNKSLQFRQDGHLRVFKMLDMLNSYLSVSRVILAWALMCSTYCDATRQPCSSSCLNKQAIRFSVPQSHP